MAEELPPWNHSTLSDWPSTPAAQQNQAAEDAVLAALQSAVAEIGDAIKRVVTVTAEVSERMRSHVTQMVRANGSRSHHAIRGSRTAVKHHLPPKTKLALMSLIEIVAELLGFGVPNSLTDNDNVVDVVAASAPATSSAAPPVPARAYIAPVLLIEYVATIVASSRHRRLARGRRTVHSGNATTGTRGGLTRPGAAAVVTTAVLQRRRSGQAQHSTEALSARTRRSARSFASSS
jgi:hypothetical protein